MNCLQISELIGHWSVQTCHVKIVMPGIAECRPQSVGNRPVLWSRLKIKQQTPSLYICVSSLWEMRPANSTQAVKWYILSILLSISITDSPFPKNFNRRYACLRCFPQSGNLQKQCEAFFAAEHQHWLRLLWLPPFGHIPSRRSASSHFLYSLLSSAAMLIFCRLCVRAKSSYMRPRFLTVQMQCHSR